MNQTRLSSETYATVDEIIRAANRAVSGAQDDSRRLGVPNVYSINGRLYYETSAGCLSTVDSFADGNRAPEQADEREPE